MRKLKCRVCKKNGKLVINLGKQPLANAIKANKKKRKKIRFEIISMQKMQNSSINKRH